jgi:zinc/manganese transport system substrate-binding protein
LWPELRLNLRPSLHVRGVRRLSLLLVVIVSACGGPSTTPTSAPAGSAGNAAASGGPVGFGPPLAVLGTENFYADLLTQIGGERVTATSLLNDPNADPHAFESSPQDAALVADAKLVIVNGLGYDAFMDRLIAVSERPDRVVINVQQLLGLADDVNVHIWYDPATMPKVAAAAADALARLDPPNAAYYASREQAYLAALKPIDDKVAQLKASYAGSPIAFTEDVAGYLTNQIGLVVKTPVGFMKAVEEGTDPAPVDVASERDLFTGKVVKALLYNSQVTSPTTARIHDLAQQNGIPIVGVAETIPAAFHTYQEWQLAQLADLEHALATGG